MCYNEFGFGRVHIQLGAIQERELHIREGILHARYPTVSVTLTSRHVQTSSSEPRMSYQDSRQLNPPS